KYAVRTDALYYLQLYQQGRWQYNEWNQRWQSPGDELFTNVPSMIYPASGARDDIYRFSEIKVQRGDHIRLKYINLHYNLSKKRLLNSAISNVRFYFNIANVGVLWKRGDYSHDPMYGFDNIPPSTAYSLGLKISI